MKKTARNKKEADVNQAALVEKPKIVAEIEPQKEEKKGFSRFFSNKPIVVGLIVILLLIVVAGGIYAVSYFAEDAQITQSPEDIEKVLDEISELFLMPEGETPTVATVTDIEQLTEQPFFTNAQNGDKVILFGGIKQAILYRPSIKKIINMSPIDPDSIPQVENSIASNSAATQQEVSPTPREKIKVAIFNSTLEAGLARKGANLLDDEKFEVVGALNANGEYDNTFISVVNSSVVNKDVEGDIASSMGDVDVTSAPLPSDEAAPAGADVVVILGSDFSEAY